MGLILSRRRYGGVNDNFELEIITTTSPETITLPLTSGASYNFTANWGDGEADSDITSGTDVDRIHEYTTAGTYLITMSGTLTEFMVNNGAFDVYPKRVLNIGNTGLTRIDFYDCDKLTSIDCGDYTTSGVTSFANFARSCSALTEILNAENLITSTCTTISRFTNSATSLVTIDVSNWDVSNVGVMNSVFNGCTLVEPVGFANWDTSSATNMGEFFRNAGAIEVLDLSNWSAPSGTLGSTLRQLGSITSLDVSTWDISGVTNLSNFAILTTIPTSDYDALLIGWTGWSGGVPTKTVPNSLTPHFGASSTFTSGGDADDARQYLIDTKSWTITDGGGV